MSSPHSLVPARCGGLVSKINAGDCVLVLGPRVAVPEAVAPGGVTPFDDYLSRKLLEDLGLESGVVPNLRDALARYQQQAGDAPLRGVVQQLVGALDGQTTNLHRDLASLPFRLILMATPDRMMIQAFTEVGKTDWRESHYDYTAGTAVAVTTSLPSTDQPIVYSLFGRHDRPESMVLTDKNLLEYLVRLTKETPRLPDPIRATLKAPSTLFLFVGFGFTNWWLRLLLKVLDITGVENRSVSLALEDTSSFAAAVRENKGFFEASIYIQEGDWNALAAELAARYRGHVTRETVRPASDSTSVGGGERPLVFLSYAHEDQDAVDKLRLGLEDRGITVWQDKQNIRTGETWNAKIAEIIKRANYFVFIQTENMDLRDQRNHDGVYNRELKIALNRQADRPFGAVFVLHVTIGACRPRPEPELAALHQFKLDVETDVATLAADILAAFAGDAKRAPSSASRAV